MELVNKTAECALANGQLVQPSHISVCYRQFIQATTDRSQKSEFRNYEKCVQ